MKVRSQQRKNEVSRGSDRTDDIKNNEKEKIEAFLEKQEQEMENKNRDDALRRSTKANQAPVARAYLHISLPSFPGCRHHFLKGEMS